MEVKKYNETVFEDIKHIDEYGSEYWLARELQNVLEYKRWDKFCNVINNAKKACENSNYNVFEHFSQVGKTSKMPNGGVKNLLDYKLSRYACYLIVQNADHCTRSNLFFSSNKTSRVNRDRIFYVNGR